MKISITVDVDFDEQREIQHPLLQRILDVFRVAAPAQASTAKPSVTPRRGRSHHQRAEQVTDTEDLAEIEVDVTPGGSGATINPPAEALAADVLVAVDVAVEAGQEADPQEEAKPAAISAGDYALIAAGLRPAPTSRAEDEQAALLAQTAFEFDRVISVFGRPAAVDVSRNALPDGVKFASIEALTAAQVPAVLAALRGLE
jgi:hypothetical protein